MELARLRGEAGTPRVSLNGRGPDSSTAAAATAAGPLKPAATPAGPLKSAVQRAARLEDRIRALPLEAMFEQGGFMVTVAVGLLLGLLLPLDSLLPPPWGRVSAVLGWMYFTAWSTSFWPQLLTNWRRRSVAGLSLDFIVYNFIGFTSYSIYTCGLYYNEEVQEQYRMRHGGQNSSVQINDVFFAVHCTVLVAATGCQAMMYDRGGQTVSASCCMFSTMTVASAMALAAAVGVMHSGPQILDWLYFLSYVKLGVTLFKYTPQVALNAKRRSTEGYNVWTVLLDLFGGVLSLAQLLLDAGLAHDWSAITGNSAKFGLSFVSIGFDIVFMVQHYILYPDRGSGAGERRKRRRRWRRDGVSRAYAALDTDDESEGDSGDGTGTCYDDGDVCTFEMGMANGSEPVAGSGVGFCVERGK